MAAEPQMPSALQVAEALSQVLQKKLGNLAAEQVVLTREEAALCLGLVNGVVENLEAAQRNA